MYPIILPGSDGVGRHVRCSCNLPACVATGYMCKSHSGCYSELTPDFKISRHGCIDENPNVDLSSQCMNSPGKAVGPWGTSLLLCCNSDMCNHVDNPLARVRINESVSGASTTNLIGFNNGLTNSGFSPNSGSGAGSMGDTNAENWFRAATIFVPVCGALILFVLIAFAIKLLRSDAMDASNKLSAAYIHHVPNQTPMEQPLMKKSPIIRTSGDHLPPVHAPLLLSHSNPMHCINERDRYIVGTAKNDSSNTKNLLSSNSSSREDTYIIMQHSPQNQQLIYASSQSSPKPINSQSYRDVNINIEASNNQESSTCSNGNNKLYEKQFLPSDEKLYNNKEAIINWGQASSKVNR